nr:NCS2 family permease [Saccharibacter sp. 17.LH.SD]
MFSNFLDRYFRISQRGSTIPREIIAGLTIFGAMAYIIAINPAILASIGLDRHDMVMTTIAGAAAGTLIMALWARLPIALAPAMSSNVLFAQVIVQQAHIKVATAFTVVFLSGIFFTLLSLTRIRLKIVRGFPPAIILGIQVAIGIFIARIGLIESGIAISSPHGLTFAPLSDPLVIFSLCGLLLCALLNILKVPAGLLLTIIIMTIIGLFISDQHGHSVTALPSQLIDWPHYPTQFLFPFDFHDFFSHIGLLLPITLYVLLSDFFDATATMLSVTHRAGLSGTPEHPELDHRAFTADGAASVVGATLGTCTVSAYLESLAGAEAGGRTGLSAFIVALLFVLSCVFWPLIICIPSLATAPVLVMVGLSMLSSLSRLPNRIEDAITPLTMLLISAVTGNFMLSLACGMLLYTGIIIALRQFKRLTPIVIGLDITFFCYMILQSHF